MLGKLEQVHSIKYLIPSVIVTSERQWPKCGVLVILCVKEDDEEPALCHHLHFPGCIMRNVLSTALYKEELPVCCDLRPSLGLSASLFLVIPPQTPAKKALLLKEGVNTLHRSLRGPPV